MPVVNINRYLFRILNDFKNYLDEGHQLCALKAVNFDQGIYPDYSDLHIQQYFLLRYAYGYAFEYKAMYESLFRLYPAPAALSVTSIGCGSMVDYWGLARRLELDSPRTRVAYTGIDLNDWSYRIMARPGDQITYRVNDAVAELNGYASLDSDIYVFPKSICEFPNEAFDDLCRTFQTTPITRDRIHLMVSIRADDGSRARDIQRIEQLQQAVIGNGFTTKDETDDFWYADNPEQRICDDDEDFWYPSAIIATLLNLHTKCAYYQQHGVHENDCQDRLRRNPILRQRQVCYNILTFERNRP